MRYTAPSGLAAMSESPPPGHASRPYMGTCCMFFQVAPPSVDLNIEVSCVYGFGLCWMAGVTKPVGPEIHKLPAASRRRLGSLTTTVPSSTVTWVSILKASDDGPWADVPDEDDLEAFMQPAARRATAKHA